MQPMQPPWILPCMEQEGLTLEQLYNCDETGLQYRMLPDKTLACRHEKGAADMKKQKDRVTLMACSNATGKHKLPLVCIGKSRNPRCFKNINKDALPVRYYAQRSAGWIAPFFQPGFKMNLYYLSKSIYETTNSVTKHFYF